jgi:hypothetical protein
LQPSIQKQLIRRFKVKRPIRFAIYVALLVFAWFILVPALSIDTARIISFAKATLGQMNSLALAGLVFAAALVITYMITSGVGLILLGAMSLMGLVVVGILHPYLLPLLVPLFALWMFCAAARRKESDSKHSSSNHTPSKHAPSKHAPSGHAGH